MPPHKSSFEWYAEKKLVCNLTDISVGNLPNLQTSCFSSVYIEMFEIGHVVPEIWPTAMAKNCPPNRRLCPGEHERFDIDLPRYFNKTFLSILTHLQTSILQQHQQEKRTYLVNRCGGKQYSIISANDRPLTHKISNTLFFSS